MKIKVLTTYNDKLYKKYAHRFFDTYNWSFDLMSYNEDKNLFDIIPQCKNFVDRNSHRKVKGFLWDGVRFCYKVYSYTHAILTEPADGLIYMDADSVFYKPIDEDFVKKYLYRDDCMVTYLGRNKQYTECGFLYFNLNHPEIKNFAKDIQEMYNTDGVYELKEYHDCEVFDTVRKRYEKDLGVKNINLTPNFDTGHVQAASILGKYYDHTKGEQRKIIGRSRENHQL